MKIPNVFVDSSYVVYFTTYSVWNWYKKEFVPVLPEDGSFDPILDEEFKAEFKKRFNWNVINSTRKLVPIIDKSRIYFCLDCKRSSIWRNSVFPAYKISRSDKVQEFTFNGIFNYVNDILLPNYAEQYGSKILKVNGAEGDDIIAICVTKKFKGEENVIVTADHDLIQLQEYARLVNLKAEELTTDKSTEAFILHKALIGDKSDEIPSFAPRIGPVTADKYINNNELLVEKLQENPEYVENLQRNLEIMDFRNIPKEIEDAINEALREVDETVNFNEL